MRMYKTFDDELMDDVSQFQNWDASEILMHGLQALDLAAGKCCDHDEAVFARLSI